MRACRVGAVAGAVLLASPALAEPVLASPAVTEPLSFVVGADRYEVAAENLAGVTLGEGLDICLTPAAETDLAAFTARHLDETVAVNIGSTNVIYLKLLKPYAGGCINWPVHPVVARRYQSLLTGTPTSGALAAPEHETTSTGAN